MIYNSSATPSTSCKTDIIISNKMQAIPTRVRDVAKARWSGAALLFDLGRPDIWIEILYLQ